MTIERANEIAKVIETLNNGISDNYFEHEITERKTGGYQVHVWLYNMAYAHELNALIMVIESCLKVNAMQKVKDEGEIIWKIW